MCRNTADTAQKHSTPTDSTGAVEGNMHAHSTGTANTARGLSKHSTQQTQQTGAVEGNHSTDSTRTQQTHTHAHGRQGLSKDTADTADMVIARLTRVSGASGTTTR